MVSNKYSQYQLSYLCKHYIIFNYHDLCDESLFHTIKVISGKKRFSLIKIEKDKLNNEHYMPAIFIVAL